MSNIIDTFAIFTLQLSEYENYRIEVSSYNQKYFSNSTDMINSYAILFNDLKEFCSMNGKVRIIDFLEDSVANNYYLCDSITKLSYKISDDSIIFQDGSENIYINMGEFYIDNYQVNICGSNLFFTDLISTSSFMYYGD